MQNKNLKPKYAVEPVEGKVERNKMSFSKTSGGLQAEVVKEDAGYMCYFPNGNSIRISKEKELERLGFNIPAPIIDVTMDGDDQLIAGQGAVATEDDVVEMKKQVAKRTRSKAQVNRNSK